MITLFETSLDVITLSLLLDRKKGLILKTSGPSELNTIEWDITQKPEILLACIGKVTTLNAKDFKDHPQLSHGFEATDDKEIKGFMQVIEDQMDYIRLFLFGKSPRNINIVLHKTEVFQMRVLIENYWND